MKSMNNENFPYFTIGYNSNKKIKVFYEKEILNIHVCGYDTFYTGLTVSRNSQFVDRARQQGYSRYETNEIMTRNVVKISIDWKVHQDMMPAFPQNLEKLILKIDFGDWVMDVRFQGRSIIAGCLSGGVHKIEMK